MPIIRDSMMAQMVDSLPAMWENWVRSMGREDPLEMEMTTHSRILAWNPMDGGAWQTIVHGVAKSRTRLSNFAADNNKSSKLRVTVIEVDLV